MDKLTLVDNGMEFMCKFAAPSVLTGRFVADILDSNEECVREAFQNPGDMLVHNMEELYPDKTYKGYAGIYSLTVGDSIRVVVNNE